MNKFFTENAQRFQRSRAGQSCPPLLSLQTAWRKRSGRSVPEPKERRLQATRESHRRSKYADIGTLYNESNQSVEAGKAFDAAFVSYRDSGDQLKEYQSSYQVGANLLKVADHFAASDSVKRSAFMKRR